ncbi:RNA-directed DNA polymerase [Staphylococcus hominis]|uniref:RNA-directed DNA polymerase n=1 Tax=Staphylococcus hominis TaxID=1290 RepID=UPI0021A5A72B|nr:RNA-directed DNA polymerase [Staphylococcus hominis]MCT1483299.1 RNA-directed DNA polymerase [Staphylococcus hominis]
MKNFKYITEMNNEEARAFLLKSESYCNIELPRYINFDSILSEVNKIVENIAPEKIKTHIEVKKLKSQESVNCKIYANKDGKFDWRPLEIINPYLYVYIVRYITEPENWKKLIDFFNTHKVNNIKVASIPGESQKGSKDKKEQILNWWSDVEQESIELALDYKRIMHLDISNCYGSIYTHTIPWALHTKHVAKSNQNNNDLLGNKIDSLIQLMQNGQTNGIPQGSVLMDFIAEIILSYVDKLLDEKIKDQNLDYKIIRYRDDYRIFSNDSNHINDITKALNDTLMFLNLKLNSKKTIYSEDVISSSMKEDKIVYQTFISTIYTKDQFGKMIFHLSIQNHLLQILIFSKKYPNSGSIVKMLDEFNKFRLKNIKKKKNNDIIQCISILIEIMLNNIKTTPLCIACLSVFINQLEEEFQKEVLSKIIKKVEDIPNVDLVNIWLQRLTIKEDKSKKYETDICNFIAGEKIDIFNNTWIKTKKHKINMNSIINEEYITKMNNIINLNEVSVFNY